LSRVARRQTPLPLPYIDANTFKGQAEIHSAAVGQSVKSLPRRPVSHNDAKGAPLAALVCIALQNGYSGATMFQLAKEFMLFLRQEKKWWLIPLIVMLLILGALLIFGSSPILAPLMYPFM